jgi:hypothetical protein
MIKLRKLYDQITSREKMLLAIFLWVLVLIWLSTYLSRMAALIRDIQTVNATLVYQQLWLDREATIEERLVESRKILDPNKTYNRSRFIGRVDGLARVSGATYDVTNPTTSLGDVFNEHSLTVQFRDVSMKTLLDFDHAIYKEDPNLGIKQVKISPNRRDPNLLNAQFDVVALELKNIENVKSEE